MRLGRQFCGSVSVDDHVHTKRDPSQIVPSCRRASRIGVDRCRGCRSSAIPLGRSLHDKVYGAPKALSNRLNYYSFAACAGTAEPASLFTTRAVFRSCNWMTCPCSHHERMNSSHFRSTHRSAAGSLGFTLRYNPVDFCAVAGQAAATAPAAHRGSSAGPRIRQSYQDSFENAGRLLERPRPCLQKKSHKRTCGSNAPRQGDHLSHQKPMNFSPDPQCASVMAITFTDRYADHAHSYSMTILFAGPVLPNCKRDRLVRRS